jgi:hypothetical protein
MLSIFNGWMVMYNRLPINYSVHSSSQTQLHSSSVTPPPRQLLSVDTGTELYTDFNLVNDD